MAVINTMYHFVDPDLGDEIFLEKKETLILK